MLLEFLSFILVLHYQFLRLLTSTTGWIRYELDFWLSKTFIFRKMRETVVLPKRKWPHFQLSEKRKMNLKMWQKAKFKNCNIRFTQHFSLRWSSLNSLSDSVSLSLSFSLFVSVCLSLYLAFSLSLTLSLLWKRV